MSFDSNEDFCVRDAYKKGHADALSSEYVQALELLAKACITKEDAREGFGLEDAGRALWLDAYAEYQAALEAVRKVMP